MSDEAELMAIYRVLPEAGRRALLLRARRLARAQSVASPPPSEHETVAQAITRLVGAYPALNRLRMLDAGSRALEAHLLHGRAAAEVIAELEAVFAARAQEG